MEKKFKRALIGYSPADLEDYLNKINTDFDNKMEELRKQQADEIHHLELLKVQVQNVRDEIDSYSTIKNMILKLLFAAHYESTEKVYKALKYVEQAEKKAADKVLLKKAELAKLKKDIDIIMGEIISVTGQYKSILDKVEGVQPDA